MRGKKAKQLREMAAMIYNVTPQQLRIKSVSQIYEELKIVHKNKATNGNKKKSEIL